MELPVEETYPEENDAGAVADLEQSLVSSGLVKVLELRRPHEDEEDIKTPLDESLDEEALDYNPENLFDREPTEEDLDDEEIRELELVAQKDTGNLHTDSINQYLSINGNHEILTQAQEVRYAKLMEQGLEAEKALADLMESGEDWMSTEGVLDLQNQIEAGNRAKQTMIECNVKLVVSVVKKYQNQGVPLADLIQEGNLGLIRGVEKFDWRKGFKLSTYATWWIKQAAQRSIPNSARTIRLPVHVQERILAIAKAKRSVWEEEGYEADINEISEITGLRPVQIQEAEDAQKMQPVSLNQLIGEDSDTEFGDWMDPAKNREVEIKEDPAELTAKEQRRQEIINALSNLTDQQQQVLWFRFGLGGEDPMTLEETGKKIGVDRAKATQIESEAIKKLQTFPELKEKLEDPEIFETEDQRQDRSDKKMKKMEKKLQEENGLGIIIDGLSSTLNVIAYMFYKGDNAPQISRKLGIAETTAKNHLTNLKKQLDTENDRTGVKTREKLGELYEAQAEVA